MNYGLTTVLSLLLCFAYVAESLAKTVDAKREVRMYDKQLAKARDNKSAKSSKYLYKRKPVCQPAQEQPLEDKGEDLILEDVQET